MPKQRSISRLDIKTNQGDAIRRLSGLTVPNVLVISFTFIFFASATVSYQCCLCRPWNQAALTRH